MAQMQMATTLPLPSTRTQYDPFQRLASDDPFHHQKRDSYAALDPEARPSISLPHPTPSNRMARTNQAKIPGRKNRKGNQAKPSSHTGRTGHIGLLRIRRGGRRGTNDEPVGAHRISIRKRAAPLVVKTEVQGLRQASIRRRAHPGSNQRRDSQRELWLMAMLRGMLNFRLAMVMEQCLRPWRRPLTRLPG